MSRQITEHLKQTRSELRNDLKKKDAWKGDHSGCEVGHRDGFCLSINAWRLNGHAKIVPVVIGRPSNRRFHSMVEYSDKSEREPEAAWRAKGWRDIEEVGGVRPIPEIVAKMRELASEELERGMQFKKFEYDSIAKAKAAFLAKFDEANGYAPTGAESDGGTGDGSTASTSPTSPGGSGGFVGTNPPKKGRDRG